MWYAKVFCEPLATIKQYRIFFNHNTMVVNNHFIRESHLWQLSPYPGQVVTPHSIAWKVISKLNWVKIIVYSIALRCKKVQSSIEKFNWSKKLRKTENLFFKAGACLIGSKKSKIFFSHKSTLNIFKNMPTKF